MKPVLILQHLHLDGPRIPQVLPALEASGVKIVVDHFGRPDPERGIDCEGFRMMLRSIEKGRTWVKVSAAYRLGAERAEAYGRELLKQVGPDRLMWASDCPFAGFEGKVTYQETIDAYDALGVGLDRLFLIEHFGQTTADKSWGRAGVSVAGWHNAIEARSAAAQAVGFAGFISYAWSWNLMHETDENRLAFEATYVAQSLP